MWRETVLVLLAAAGLCGQQVRVVASPGAVPGVPKVTVARWPGERQAAISLTFDDGIDTHLDIAGPILKKHGLAGTFFVNTDRGAWQHRLDAWKRLAADGNEIANHTVHHPCLLPAITPRSQDFTPAMMERDILDSAREIEEKIGAGRGLTFAYPCGNLAFGPPADQARNTPRFFQYVAACCFAARGYGAGGAAQDPDEINVLNVTDLGMTTGKSFSELLEMAQPALRAGTWGVYGFHGVGGDWLWVSADSFDELTAYLARHPEIWTATFGDGVRYIQERQALGMAVTRTGAGAIEIGLKWPLDRRIFDLPLTLRIEVPAAGTTARADGNAVAVRSVEGGQALLVDVKPGTVKLVIETPAR
jgi:peptidoglycan/xylan/chitin deacetylase (PgdA/CDA1 family)